MSISEMLLMPLWRGICSTGWTESVISKGQAVFPWLLKLDGVKWLWLSTRVPSTCACPEEQWLGWKGQREAKK